ncbi:MAG: DNA primase [Prevotella sp.]|nr:DNA primase [Prevotella sp.]
MIDSRTIDRIMDAANIVDVVSEFVTLKKSGANYKGLCPFHNDRTPSFSVSPARGIYKCFSCGKAGNAANFIMEHEQMTYPEALKWLAKKYNIEVEERELTPEERRQETERESIFIVNEWAAGYFNDNLLNDPDGQAIGLAYFRSRGFRDDIIAKFRLGYALSRRDALLDTARKKGYNEEYLVTSGLCVKRDDGSLYDRFSGRVIFPWIGVGGKVTAFGGRLLDARTKGVAQKYVNSPDSVVYHKDHELYGIYQAKKAMSKEDCVFMVEGYTDVISMHQCGIENVVANSGTALSVHQIRLLHRFTQNVVLLYDGDEAGIHAALRGTDMMLAEGMNIKVLLLPDGDDPDSFARKHTANDFREYIASHQTDFIEFKTQVMLKGVTDPVKRAEAISSIVKSISEVKDPIIRATYVKDCSQRTGIAEQTLINQMNKFIRSGREEKARQVEREKAREERETPVTPKTESKAGPPAAARVTLQIEQLLVQMVFRHGSEMAFRGLDGGGGETFDLTVAEYIYYDLQEDGLQLHDGVCQGILEEAVTLVQEGETNLLDHFTRHPDPAVSKLASALGEESYQLSESMRVKMEEERLRAQVEHLLLDYRLDILKNRMNAIRIEYAAAGSDERRVQLLDEVKKLQEMRSVIAKRLGKSIII